MVFACSHASFAALGIECKCLQGSVSHNRASSRHVVPRELAEKYADTAQRFFDSDSLKHTNREFVKWGSALMPLAVRIGTKTAPRKSPLHRRSHQDIICDGGGIHSTGDWSVPPRGMEDALKPLRKRLLKLVMD